MWLKVVCVGQNRCVEVRVLRIIIQIALYNGFESSVKSLDLSVGLRIISHCELIMNVHDLTDIQKELRGKTLAAVG